MNIGDCAQRLKSEQLYRWKEKGNTLSKSLGRQCEVKFSSGELQEMPVCSAVQPHAPAFLWPISLSGRMAHVHAEVAYLYVFIFIPS
jgi:hypothetical protein